MPAGNGQATTAEEEGEVHAAISKTVSNTHQACFHQFQSIQPGDEPLRVSKRRSAAH
jgi:hypothetical protein